MANQMIFKRYEIKYILSKRQRDILMRTMEPYMAADEYGHSSIRNLYFDTDSYLLARRSMEKPEYKEKLRVRSYGPAEMQDKVFVELKKKYASVVYKRRMELPQSQALSWLCGYEAKPLDTQICNEINYFRSYYQTLHPVAFLSYSRDAFRALDGSEFRVTFDEDILAREDELCLVSSVWGSPLLDTDLVLLELKTAGGIPCWMTRFLTSQRIFKTSFSKYGEAYRNIIYKRNQGGVLYA